MTSTLLAPVGIACLLASFVVLRGLIPQDGKPSAWTSTEMRSTLVSLGLMMLMITGIALIIRGLTG